MTNIPLYSKKDYRSLFREINEPLTRHFTEEDSRIYFGQNGVAYGKNIAGIEGFSRFLWGAGPDILNLPKNLQTKIVNGIQHGTDPRSESYWGDLSDRDQRMVEMPAIALALYHHEHWLWNQFESYEQTNMFNWFNQINHHEAANGNWQFFRVIVNIVFEKFGYQIPKDAQAQALQAIEHCYLDQGWYRDSSRGRLDYYNPFAFHYYGLIYAALKPTDPLATKFKKRAQQFARQYIHFFAENGANVPFGRSLIYRYAVSAFWSAMVYSGLAQNELGVIKGIINRNLRWWLQQDIFDSNHRLSLGYTYPQLSITEPYNSAVSPYWSNKVFLLLALPPTHAYWQTAEVALPKRSQKVLLEQPAILVDHDHGHTQFLNAGQPGPNYHTLTNEKYFKFAYSTYFGFSIPRSSEQISEAAMDSMLGVQLMRNGVSASGIGQETTVVNQFMVRNQVADVVTTNDFVASTWNPFDGVSIRTWLIALNGWQIRIHRFRLDQVVVTNETGFALPYEYVNDANLKKVKQKNYWQNEKGVSGIVDLASKNPARSVSSEIGLPNTNIMDSGLTWIPGLTGVLDIGQHYLVTGIYAHFLSDYGVQKWCERPTAELNSNIATIMDKKQVITIKLE